MLRQQNRERVKRQYIFRNVSKLSLQVIDNITI